MTPRLIYTDFVAQIKSSSGLFFCYWLTCGIVMAYLWPRSGKQEWATQGPSFHAACGPDPHPTSTRCGPDLGRNNVAMWLCVSRFVNECVCMGVVADYPPGLSATGVVQTLLLLIKIYQSYTYIESIQLSSCTWC